MIRPAEPGDAEQIRAIYNEYVAATVITFEEEPVARADMAQRIANGADRYPWLVAEADGRILGYAYAAQWRPRSAYRLAVETTVYIHGDHQRQGHGYSLYDTLLGQLRVHGFHRAIAAIALPNPASVVLHERLGFRKAGELDEVGWKLGRWVNVGYWEMPLA